MPKDYGPGGKWIHDRAHHLMSEMKDQYGSDKGKQVAYATATQQAHKLGKTPKSGAGPRGTFGTPSGKRTALRKHDRPRSAYVVTPKPKTAAEELLALLPGHLLLRKVAASLDLPDAETGLTPKPKSLGISSKPKNYSQINTLSTPPTRGLAAPAKSTPPPKV